MQDKEIERIIHKVSLETMVEKDIVREIFDSYYLIIKNEMDKSQYDKLESFPIVLIPYIGRLTINPYKHSKLNEILSKRQLTGNGKDKIRKVKQENTEERNS